MKLNGSATVPWSVWDEVIGYVLSDTLRTARRQTSLTRADAASRLGVSPGELAACETGASKPTPQHLIDLATLYETKPRAIFDTVLAHFARAGVELNTDSLNLNRMSSSANAHFHPLRIWAQEWMLHPAYRRYTVMAIHPAARTLLAQICGVDENGS